MASLLAAVTALTLGGTPGLPAYTPQVSDAFARPSSLDITRLRLGGVSFQKRTDFSGKDLESTYPLSLTDTAYLSATETPNDSQEIITYDTIGVSVSESLAIARQISGAETANLTLSEVVNLNVTGVTTLTPTDTASISASDASAIAVSLAITDDASISVTDISSVAETVDSKSGTDDALVSVTDSATVNIFTGVLELNVTDLWTVAMSDSAVREDARYVSRIVFSQSGPRMMFRKV